MRLAHRVEVSLKDRYVDVHDTLKSETLLDIINQVPV
jgi:hypothetical protein